MEPKLQSAYERKFKALARREHTRFKKLEDVESLYHYNRVGKFLADFVFGASDGIVTTFAIVAASAGASLPSLVIIVLGLANLLGDGISMGLGNYLGKKSEREYQERQREKEGWEVDNFPEIEREEVRQTLATMGFGGDGLESALQVISKDKKVWVEFMMRYELGIVESDEITPAIHGFATFLSFFSAGLIPLLPFLIPAAGSVALPLSIFSTGIALFAVGALRGTIYPKSWFRGGIEIFLVGSFAAAAAYLIGFFLQKLITTFV